MQLLSDIVATVLLVCCAVWAVMHYGLTEQKVKALAKKYGKRENANALLMLLGGIFLGLSVFFEISLYLLALGVAVALIYLAIWLLRREA